VNVYQLNYDCSNDYSPCSYTGYDGTIYNTINLPGQLNPCSLCSNPITPCFKLPPGDPYAYRAVDYVQLNDGFDSDVADLYINNIVCDH